MIAIVAKNDGWHIEDHLSAQPGKKRGAALRHLILPQLAAVADAGSITLHATAANAVLARQYQSELEGLKDVGAGFPRGRKLRRDPRPMSILEESIAAETGASDERFLPNAKAWVWVGALAVLFLMLVGFGVFIGSRVSGTDAVWGGFVCATLGTLLKAVDWIWHEWLEQGNYAEGPRSKKVWGWFSLISWSAILTGMPMAVVGLIQR